VSAELIEAIRANWAWTGVEPERVTATSPFGHLIVRDIDGAFWHLDPEIRTLKRVVADERGLIAYMNDPEVRETWEARYHVGLARDKLGPAPPGRCYSFPIGALVEGDFTSRDFWLPPIAELIGVMGSIESQLRDVPDGQSVRFVVRD